LWVILSLLHAATPPINETLAAHFALKTAFNFKIKTTAVCVAAQDRTGDL
jgi:hypothetical protein